MTINNYKISRKELWIILGSITILCFIIFGNGIKGDFVYDDIWVIQSNPTLENISSVPGQLISPYHYSQPETGLYRPLTLISYSVNYIFGKSPAGFHAVNILLHAVNVFLIFLLVFSLFKSKLLAFITAGIFMVLPIHTEAVSFISGRSDLLAFTFSLLTLLSVYYKRYWLGSVVFLLALLAKESAIGIIPVIFLMQVFLNKERFSSAFRNSLKFIPAGAIYIILRWVALGGNFLANDANNIYNPLKFTDVFSRLFTALKVMLMYFSKTLVPLNLTADYSYNQISLIKTPLNFYIVLGVLMIICFAYFAFSKKTRETPLGFASLFFISSYLIVSNFIFPIGTIMAERIFYMSSMAICLMIAVIFDYLINRGFKNLWIGILILVAIIFGVINIGRNRVWLSEEALYKDMVMRSPLSAHAKTNLGVYYIKAGEWSEGKKLLEESYGIAPDNLPTLNSLGIVAEYEKRYADAEKFYLKAIELNVYYINALSNLSRMYFEVGQYQRSANISWHAFSHKQQPNFLFFYAMSLLKMRQYDEAISIIKEYYGESPQDLNLQFALGYAYYKKGDKITANKYFINSKDPSMSVDEFIKGIEGP